MKNDPALAEIRQNRHRISAENDHDPRKLVAYYIRMQKVFPERVIIESFDEETHGAEVR